MSAERLIVMTNGDSRDLDRASRSSLYKRETWVIARNRAARYRSRALMQFATEVRERCWTTLEHSRVLLGTNGWKDAHGRRA